MDWPLGLLLGAWWWVLVPGGCPRPMGGGVPPWSGIAVAGMCASAVVVGMGMAACLHGGMLRLWCVVVVLGGGVLRLWWACLHGVPVCVGALC